MDSQFVVVGQVVAPWGLRGEMKVEAMTDFPDRFSPQEEIHVDRNPMTIERSRWHKGRVILKLATIDSVEAAEKLRRRFLEVPESKLRPLPEGQYYRFQLIGLDVLTAGSFWGRSSRYCPLGATMSTWCRQKTGNCLSPLSMMW